MVGGWVNGWQAASTTNIETADASGLMWLYDLTPIIYFICHKLLMFNRNPPLLEEFRKFFLASHGFDAAGDRLLDCQRPSILFIWRRDYVAHPRNPTGKLTRKITNERELIDHVRLAHPDFRVDGIQLDSMAMEDQLRYIVNADVLVGMHGAGLTHSIFLSNRSALVELLPTYWSSGDHFRAIANWRGLVYRRWINTDFAAESSDLRTTRVPVRIIDDLIVNALTSMCGSQCQSCQPTKSRWRLFMVTS